MRRMSATGGNGQCEAVALSAAEAERFHRDGFLGPYEALPPAAMDVVRARLEREVLNSTGPAGRPLAMRHLDRRAVYDLVTLPPIVRRVQGILGPHLLLWACTMWLKDPGGREVPWHQDRNYWPVEPIVNVTAWIAVDPVTPSNGCLEVIPGSHRTVVPHVAAPPGKWFSEQADPCHVDSAGARQLLLEPGQFVLFNDRLLHRSAVNRSAQRRLAMGPRFTIPIARIDHDALFPGHRAILVSGRDYMGFNRLTAPPGDHVRGVSHAHAVSGATAPAPNE